MYVMYFRIIFCFYVYFVLFYICSELLRSIQSFDSRGWKTTYIVHYSSPAFHSNALENSEHSKSDAVEADDAELGTFPAGRADWPVSWTDESFAAEATAAVGARCQLGLIGEVPLIFNSQQHQSRNNDTAPNTIIVPCHSWI